MLKFFKFESTASNMLVVGIGTGIGGRFDGHETKFDSMLGQSPSDLHSDLH